MPSVATPLLEGTLTEPHGEMTAMTRIVLDLCENNLTSHSNTAEYRAGNIPHCTTRSPTPKRFRGGCYRHTLFRPAHYTSTCTLPNASHNAQTAMTPLRSTMPLGRASSRAPTPPHNSGRHRVSSVTSGEQLDLVTRASRKVLAH
ncbi:hypothetical protein HPB50_023825 [Hyalomma asiaticum]|uniref:Uncharacterized protein n=1 Tax=Hyalomma asiaticum TaxID=266040 RepID=A0ACB7TNK1_HYAAI|nr:hypothetical protein HPB50_023825 [Hyalomma asiaticum]